MQNREVAGIFREMVKMLEILSGNPFRHRLWKELQITDLSQLERALQQGKVQKLPGMGARRAAKIREGIAQYRRRTGRFRLDHALATSQAIFPYQN